MRQRADGDCPTTPMRYQTPAQPWYACQIFPTRPVASYISFGVILLALSVLIESALLMGGDWAKLDMIHCHIPLILGLAVLICGRLLELRKRKNVRNQQRQRAKGMSCHADPITKTTSAPSARTTDSVYIICLCNQCSGQIRFPEAGIGREAPCPHCGLTTTLYSPPVPIEHSEAAPASEKAPKPPPIPKTQATKKCPFCAELILHDAIKCKHCGEYIDGRKKPQPQSVGAGVFSGLFWFFIGVPLIILACIVLIMILGSLGSK